MNKKVLFLPLILILVGILFIPISEQKTIRIKAPYFNVYQRLSKGLYWKDLNKEIDNSQEITTNQQVDGFEIKANNYFYKVKIKGYNFSVNISKGNQSTAFNYLLVPQKSTDSTFILNIKKTNLIAFIIAKIGLRSDLPNNIDDFKAYMETPKRYYGFEITKRKVTDTCILVLKRLVLTKNKFLEAKKSYEIIKKYISKENLLQTQPLMAQFINKQNDSSEINIGIPINKETNPKNQIRFLRMPKTGNLYTLYFKGKFKDREKAYSAIQSFYNDQNLAMPILPFEIYLENKLPNSDDEEVKIELKCSTY